MIEIKNALKIVDRETRHLASERVTLGDSVGRVLAEDIVADMDLPPFDRSQMDGYAVIAGHTVDAPVSLNIIGESSAGKGWGGRLEKGQAVRIMTGARVPSGASAVQRVELTTDKGDLVTILKPVNSETAIVRQGSEITRGTMVIRTGRLITDNMIPVLASFGYAKVKVGKLPRVAILGTGSEIVEVSKKPGRDQIRNSNSIMLDVFCRRFGASTTVLPNVGDVVQDLKMSLRSAARNSDIVIITGGVSVGKYDHTETGLAELGAQIFFDKLRLKPGKPAVFARLGKSLIFGLPGNPVSAAVTFHLLVRRAILKMQGTESVGLTHGTALIGSDVKADRERETYVPSRLQTDETGHLVAHPLKWQGSSDFIGFAGADSLILIRNGEAKLKGDVVDIVYL